MSNDLPRHLAQLASWQSGLLTMAQALSGGLSKDLVRSLEQRHQWQRLHAGVYATFSGPVPREGALWAAVLRAGPGAVLSYWTAAELDQLIDQPVERIHLTIPQSRRVDPIDGARLHRSERVTAARHPVLVPPRTRIEETVLDLAAAATTLDDACGWVTRAVGRRLTTPGLLSTAMGQRVRLRWRPELTELLSADAAGVQSVLEYRYLRDVERPHALPRGTRQARATAGARRIYRDVLYDGYALVVELDGQAAHLVDERQRDTRRDNAAIAEGLATLRYGWLEVRRQPCVVAAEVARALGQRGFRGARPCSPGCPVRPERPGLSARVGA